MKQQTDIWYSIGQSLGNLFAYLVAGGLMIVAVLLVLAAVKWAWGLL